ncbi:S-locus lectin protein kinase family protein [Perilla frutescens var. frutescens]|nr:S-locus lectin protein kinase family protein [Perilla frutescens var. frutescens]
MLIRINFVISAIVYYSWWARLCRAQGNSNTSTGPCGGNGVCGAFGSCNAQDSPICSCLPGFTAQNRQEWDSGNWSSGCQRRASLNCHNGTTNDGFLKLQSMKISGYSARFSGPKDQCEARCLRNCSCLAYAFDSGIGCMFWSIALIDVQEFSTGSGSDLYVRVSLSDLDKKDSKKIIIILVVVGFVVISICTYFCWKWIARRGKRKTIELGNARDNSPEDAPSQVNLEDLPLFKFEVLANATNNFSEANWLGKGGFGPVYMIRPISLSASQLKNGLQISFPCSGYMAPEYAMEGRFSEKSDIFSIGVLILEIATGRRNTSFYPKEGSLNLLGHVWTAWNEDNAATLIDPRVSSSSNQAEVTRCMHIGLLCVQELPKDRPSVSAVLSMLSSETIELPEPKQSAFSIKSSRSDTGASSSQQSKSSASMNNITLTMVDGR